MTFTHTIERRTTLAWLGAGLLGAPADALSVSAGAGEAEPSGASAGGAARPGRELRREQREARRNRRVAGRAERNPQAVSSAAAVPEAEVAAVAEVVDDVWRDEARGRSVPVRIRWPAHLSAGVGAPQPAPLIVFSHGLGGSRDGGTVWGAAWSQAGFVVLHLQHPGSDTAAVRASVGNFTDRTQLRALGGADQLAARLADGRFALDEVLRRQALAASAGAIDARWAQVRRYGFGMAGHSFGAHTALGLAGQRYPQGQGMADGRFAAFLTLSATAPPNDAQGAFAAIAAPTLCVTGTLDCDVVGNGATPAQRAAVYAALPARLTKAQLVLDGADHLTFAGNTGRANDVIPRPAASRERQSQHHAVVARLSTAWWDAMLRAGPAAWRSPQGLSAGDSWVQGG